MTFDAKRIVRTFTQTINATPDVVFPLICPVREAEWLDGWNYTMVYSKSGLAERGAVFSTPGENDEDTIWIISKHDSGAHEVEFVRVTAHSTACVLKVHAVPKDDHHSYVEIEYVYTNLTDKGNAFLESCSEEEFLNRMMWWEKSMNYFLETGKRLMRS